MQKVHAPQNYALSRMQSTFLSFSIHCWQSYLGGILFSLLISPKTCLRTDKIFPLYIILIVPDCVCRLLGIYYECNYLCYFILGKAWFRLSSLSLAGGDSNDKRGKKRHFAPCPRPGGINETYIFFAQFIFTKNAGFWTRGSQAVFICGEAIRSSNARGC